MSKRGWKVYYRNGGSDAPAPVPTWLLVVAALVLVAAGYTLHVLFH
jgi:hypothetical protein